MGTRVPKDIDSTRNGRLPTKRTPGLHQSPSRVDPTRMWRQGIPLQGEGRHFLGWIHAGQVPGPLQAQLLLRRRYAREPRHVREAQGQDHQVGSQPWPLHQDRCRQPRPPNDQDVGLVAGDEESYELFAELMDPVISARHNGYAADAKHPTDMNPANLSTTPIDPTGKYVLTTRCRTGRSVRGPRLPPCTTFEERRELERVIVKGLEGLTGDLKGEYFPLHGSQSFAAKPNGMTEEKEEALRKNGNLFQEPDSTLLLSSGCGRHWPDARGIFHNEAENFFVWVNEEDQMRIVSMQKGASVVEFFKRFAAATEGIQKVLKAEGYDFMHNDHLGWVLTCPSNLGTGLRAGAMVKVPHFSARKDFRDVMGRMGLQARGTAGVDSASTGGTWDISNADRLGKSETQLVNIFIEGVAQIIRWEQDLEAGKVIEAEVAKASLPKNSKSRKAPYLY